MKTSWITNRFNVVWGQIKLYWEEMHRDWTTDGATVFKLIGNFLFILSVILWELWPCDRDGRTLKVRYMLYFLTRSLSSVTEFYLTLWSPWNYSLIRNHDAFLQYLKSISEMWKMVDKVVSCLLRPLLWLITNRPIEVELRSLNLVDICYCISTGQKNLLGATSVVYTRQFHRANILLLHQ